MSPISNNPNDNVFSVNHAGLALAVMNNVMTGGESSGAVRPDSGNKTSRKSITGKMHIKKKEDLIATLQAATRR